MDIEIFTDKTWEQIKPHRERTEKRYPFYRMKPGQYFVLREDLTPALTNKLNQAAMRAGVYYAIKKAYNYDSKLDEYLKVYNDGYRHMTRNE